MGGWNMKKALCLFMALLMGLSLCTAALAREGEAAFEPVTRIPGTYSLLCKEAPGRVE